MWHPHGRCLGADAGPGRLAHDPTTDAGAQVAWQTAAFLEVAVSALHQGQRLGSYVLFTDSDGLRYAVRLNSILALRDGDESQDTTLLQLTGGRTILVPSPLDEVVGWLGWESQAGRA
jgi:hypothetical protein